VLFSLYTFLFLSQKFRKYLAEIKCTFVKEWHRFNIRLSKRIFAFKANIFFDKRLMKQNTFDIRSFLRNDQLKIIIQEIIFYFQTIFSLFNTFDGNNFQLIKNLFHLLFLTVHSQLSILIFRFLFLLFQLPTNIILSIICSLKRRASLTTMNCPLCWAPWFPM